MHITICVFEHLWKKNLLQIDFHAFVLSIMNINLLFAIYFYLFYFECFVYFSAVVANKDIYYSWRDQNASTPLSSMWELQKKRDNMLKIKIMWKHVKTENTVNTKILKTWQKRANVHNSFIDHQVALLTCRRRVFENTNLYFWWNHIPSMWLELGIKTWFSLSSSSPFILKRHILFCWAKIGLSLPNLAPWLPQ